MSLSLWGQVPNLMHYQGIALDDFNNTINNTEIDMELSLWIDGKGGSEVFREGHRVHTNSKGIFSLQIGNGSPLFRSLSNVDFSVGEYWIQTEADLDEDGQMEDLGFSRLVTVPFAFHAKSVANKDDADADPNNEFQDLNINRNNPIIELGISDGQGVTFSVSDDDSDPGNELQTLTRSGTKIVLSQGGEVEDMVEDADADSANELQNLLRVGDFIELSHGGGSIKDEVDDADADPTNEIQQLSIKGDSLLLSQTQGIHLPFTSYWEKDGDSLRYSKGSVSIQSPDSSSTNYSSFYRTALTTPDDTNAIYAFGNVLKSGFDPIVTVYERRGIEFYWDTLGFWLHRARYSPDSVRFVGGSNGNYGRDFLQFKVDSLPFLVTSAMNEQFLVQALDTFTSFRTAYNTSLESTNYRSKLSPGKLELAEKNTPQGERASWTMAKDSLIGKNELDFKTIELSNHPITKNGRLILNGTGNRRLAYLGDEFISPGTGIFALYGSDQNLILNIASTYGESKWSSNNGSDNVVISVEENNSARGRIEIMNSSGDRVLQQGVNSREQGYLEIYDKSDNVDLSLDGDGFVLNHWLRNNPLVSIQKRNPATIAEMIFNGDNGNANVRINHDGNLNEGRMDVCDGNGIPQAGLFTSNGQGHIFADVKNFRVDHPKNDKKEIWYASLEGPEAAAYVRGTATLVDGQGFVEFPEYYSLIANPSEMTIQLTPLFWDTYGLAVIRKTEKGFEVKELKGGKGTFEFDWEVKCVRKGHENFQVIRNK